MRWLLAVLLCLSVSVWSMAHAEPLEPAYFPSLISSLRVTTPPEYCGEAVPTHIEDVGERLEKELLLALWDRPQVLLWLKRSRRYLPCIEAILERNGMPDDLKYASVAESALRPHVRSRRGAVGFWQFTSYAGEKYGLVINSRIDQRRNIVASTEAACRYLTDLYQSFGSWTLATAAYNMGEDGLMAEILEQGTDNYYRLYLPLETQRHLFRIIVAKLIFSHPERYGFELSDDDYYTPVQFDQVRIDCFHDTPIRIVAEAAKTQFKVIKDMNPEIRGYYLSEGSHTLSIPTGAKRGFLPRYQRGVKRWLAEQRDRIYVVKEGDSLSSIAERFDIPLAALLIWNRRDARTPIYPDDRLIIHRAKPKAPDSGSSTDNATE